MGFCKCIGVVWFGSLGEGIGFVVRECFLFKFGDLLFNEWLLWLDIILLCFLMLVRWWVGVGGFCMDMWLWFCLIVFGICEGDGGWCIDCDFWSLGKGFWCCCWLFV